MFQFSCQQKVESIIHLRKEIQLHSPSQMDSHGVADSQALSLIDYVSWLKYHTLHGIPLQQKREPFTVLAHHKLQVATHTKVKINTECSSTPYLTWISIWFFSVLLNFDVMCCFPWVIFHMLCKLLEESWGFLLGYSEHLTVMRGSSYFWYKSIKVICLNQGRDC